MNSLRIGDGGHDRINQPESTRDCIYRCGWCGYPVDGEGGPLPEIKDNDDANKYLADHEGREVQQVNGFCCPDGPNNSLYF